MYRLAYRLTGNRHDAEDLTQDVFMRVFRSLDTLRAGQLPRLAAPHHDQPVPRPGAPQVARPDGPFGEGAEDRLPSTEVAAGVAVHDANFDPDIEAALASLSEEFRVAVVLCDVEGLSYEEIADVLGIKLGTVRSRIHRGRTQLREALAHRAPRAGRTRFIGPIGA